MRNVAAYLLLTLGGNANPTAEDIKGLLGSVGIETDNERVEKLISELSGKNIDEVIAKGVGKLASMPSGGASSASAASVPAAAPAAAPAKGGKPEKKEEPKEESDDEMGFGLFD
jgi:large subunit ribosomal protein LP2